MTPYLQEGPHGQHFLCEEIDSGGSLFGMTITTKAADGTLAEIALLVPSAMVRLVLSTQPELEIGYV